MSSQYGRSNSKLSKRRATEDSDQVKISINESGDANKGIRVDDKNVRDKDVDGKNLDGKIVGGKVIEEENVDEKTVIIQSECVLYDNDKNTEITNIRYYNIKTNEQSHHTVLIVKLYQSMVHVCVYP